MKLFLISIGTSLFLFTSLVSSHSTDSNPRICQDYSIPVEVTNQIYTASYQPFASNYDVVDFSNGIASRDPATALHPFSNIQKVTGAYTISATMCSPSNFTRKEKTILLASHGLGYDRRYWDSGIQAANYSFVDFAISQGYSVFFYDRLGTGNSSKASGYNESQASTQTAILQQLTTFLRSGQYTGALGTPSKIVHIGHSFGSYISHLLIASTPGISDAAILTGIAFTEIPTAGAFVEAFGLRIATVQAPGKWPGRDNEYVTWVDAPANAAAFFHGGSYDEEVLWYTEDNKQPLAAIELLTLIFPPAPALEFTKPLMILAGEFDFAFCGGNCTGILSDGGNTKTNLYPNATDFQAVVHPGVGHGINFSYNATGAYKVVTDYLKTNGL